LPTGAATSANQATAQTSLSSIDTKTPALVSGKVPVDVGGESISVSNFPATQPVSAAALPLPAGASTEATLALIKAKTDNIDVLLSTRTKPADTQAISAAALPLPAGAATSAAQATAATSLSSIDTKTPALVSGKVPIDVSNFPAYCATEAGSLYMAGVALTVKFAKIVASASGATTIVAAVTSKKIRVIELRISASAAVNVKWQSHVTPTDLTGLAYYAANGGEVMPKSEYGWFETVAGEALDINLSAAVAVGGSLAYVEV
jgi:hypothetical protein